MNTLPITHKGVARALAWLERELFLCTIDELELEFERMFSCKFSEDRQSVVFDDDKCCWWFTSKWK